MSVAFLFPGQGAQRAGFLHNLPAAEAVDRTLAEASAWLGYDAKELDSEESLGGTVGTQLALLVAGVAFARSMMAAGVRPHAMSGMSVGMFAAATAAEALTLPDALSLVRLRGELMQSAFPGGTHGMAVVEGLGRRAVELLLQDDITIANENAPLQFVCAGEMSALDSFCVRALEAGAACATRLRMAVPSHTPALASAAKVLRRAIEQIPMRPPARLLFGNRRARPIASVEALVEELAENMAAPVMWRDVMSGLEAEGITLFLEAPPGHTLANLARANLRDVQVMSADNARWDSLVRAAQRT